MAEKPILFNAEMIRAILDGRKTQTRRVVNPQPSSRHPYHEEINDRGYVSFDNGETGESRKAPYQPGDILWVRETWARLNDDYHPDDKGSIYVYKADHITGNDGPDLIKWKSSIFMPRAAARIFLRVTDVRVERLQEILCGDMKREGCIPPTITGGQYQQWQRDYWIPLWDAINAKRGFGWEHNPWVWVIKFKKLEGGGE